MLSFAVAELLYRSFPDAAEGDLSRYRATLVSGESLAQVAAGLDLGSQVLLGEGELKSGGQRRGTILADALEALSAPSTWTGDSKRRARPCGGCSRSRCAHCRPRRN